MFQITEKNKQYLIILVSVLLIVLSIFLIFKSLSEIKNYRNSPMMNTITLEGEGEVNAIPDIAKISFTINQEALTSKEAQEKVSEIEEKVLTFLKENSIEDKDIKTQSISFYPKYEYRYSAKVSCTEFYCPPTPGKNVIVGYEANQNIEVKIRNTDDVGKIMQGLSELKVSQLDGPNFSIDDEEVLKIEARKKAILDARNQAKILAKDLGIRLGKVVSFSEGQDFYAPMYEKAIAQDSLMISRSSIAPQIPKGENTIISKVYITYEIK